MPEGSSSESTHKSRQKRSSAESANLKRKLVSGIVILACVLFLIIIVGFLERCHSSKERAKTEKTLHETALDVQVVKPTKSPTSFSFFLPGSAEAFTEATLYARVNGYLKERYVDIGDHVYKGELLAVIDAPDLDAQFNQAKSQLAQSKAALEIAKITLGREQQLINQKVVSQQEFDLNQSTYFQADANEKAATANVANLGAQEEFKNILAPFDGIITARFVDVGALISIGTSTSTSPSLFTIQQTDILRVYINVPQSYSESIKVGDSVDITLPEFPNEVFKGKITRRANALDPNARTERVEIQIPNPDEKLLPGMYLNVKFTVTQKTPTLVVPSNTLDIRKEGPRVAIVDPDNTVRFQNVVLGRDMGDRIEILSGLNGDENLIQNPSSNLAPGTKVNIKKH